MTVTEPVKPAVAVGRGVDVGLELGLERRRGGVRARVDVTVTARLPASSPESMLKLNATLAVAAGEPVTPLARPVAVDVSLRRLGAEAAVEQVLVAERGRVADPVDLVAELHDLVLRGLAGRVVRRRGVGRLRSIEVVDALQHRVDRGQRAFCGLHDRDAVLGVLRSPACRPEICIARFSLMTRPDASSAARLIR